MRTILLTSIIISVLLNVALFVMAYDADKASKDWQSKYFDMEVKANEQFDHANKYALEKYYMQRDLDHMNKQVAEANASVAAMKAQLEQKTKELEINKQISNLPFSCPSLPIVKPKAKHKKRIPFDIAPSQQ